MRTSPKPNNSPPCGSSKTRQSQRNVTYGTRSFRFYTSDVVGSQNKAVYDRLTQLFYLILSTEPCKLWLSLESTADPQLWERYLFYFSYVIICDKTAYTFSGFFSEPESIQLHFCICYLLHLDIMIYADITLIDLKKFIFSWLSLPVSKTNSQRNRKNVYGPFSGVSFFFFELVDKQITIIR